MNSRTVKFLGWGTGTAFITVLLDSKLIFHGTVELTAQSAQNESMDHAPTLFSFEIPMEFSGVHDMVCYVEDASVTFGYVVANYADITMNGMRYSSGPKIFHDVADYDSEWVKDPRKNVYINGKPQSVDRKIGKGTWQWPVPAWSCIRHDLEISKPGLVESST